MNASSRVGVRGTVPDADEGGRAAAPAQPARGVQRAALAEAKKGFVLCPGAGWWSAASDGWPDSGACRGTSNACLMCWWPCISSSSSS